MTSYLTSLTRAAATPPADWPLERRRAYFDWGAQVVAGSRGAHPRLEALFDEAFARRP